MKLRARASVVVTLQVDLPDRWGEDCGMAQINKQAREGAIALLTKTFQMNGVRSWMTVIGVPKVTAILVDEAIDQATSAAQGAGGEEGGGR